MFPARSAFPSWSASNAAPAPPAPAFSFGRPQDTQSVTGFPSPSAASPHRQERRSVGEPTPPSPPLVFDIAPPPVLPSRSSYLKRRRDGEVKWDTDGASSVNQFPNANTTFGGPTTLGMQSGTSLAQPAAGTAFQVVHPPWRKVECDDIDDPEAWEDDGDDARPGIGRKTLSSRPPPRNKRRLPDDAFSGNGEQPAAADDGSNWEHTFNVDVSLEAFYHYSGGCDEIVEANMSRLASDLGWPQRGSGDFFLLLFAFQENSLSARQGVGVTSVDRQTWLHTFSDLGTSSVKAAAVQMREWAKGAFQADATFPRFHRLTFTFLLVSGKPLIHRNFARTLPASVAKQALIATVAPFSYFVHPFCAFLDETQTRVINFDQWLSFLTFCRSMRYPDLSNYRLMDCWPVLLDDFVAWGFSRGIFASR
jgi:hypothetical protein